MMFPDEKRAHGGRMRTYGQPEAFPLGHMHICGRPMALLLRSTRIENFVGAHPLLMRAFTGLDLQQPSVIQSETTARKPSMESRRERG